MTAPITAASAPSPLVGERRHGSDGYALLEVTLALMLIALLSALALPGLARTTGPATLRVAAFQVSALLRDDRNLALASGRTTASVVDGGGRRMRSAASAAFVDLPRGAIAALRPPMASIRFFADGRSSGGDVVLASNGARYIIAVSPDTGAIRVGAP